MPNDGLTQGRFDFFPGEEKTARREGASSGATTLDALAEQARGCRRCRLREGCRGVVFGEGNPAARLVFMGEAPGAEEDLQGRPFVGAAGQLLDRILAAAGINRAEVYITNVVMCRPPFNRLPQPPEVEACRTFLEAKLRLIAPPLVVCLGALATQALVDPEGRITRMRGRWFEKDGRVYLPTFHPAALLRDPSKKKAVWEDFKMVIERYRSLQS